MILKNISFVVALATCFLNALLAGLHQGFELGSQESLPFTISGGTGYELLGRTYLFVAVCFLIFVTGRILAKDLVSNIVSVSVLIMAFFSFRTIYLQKQLFHGSTDHFTKIMRDTYPFDLIGLALTLTLLIIEIILISKTVATSRRKAPNP